MGVSANSASKGRRQNVFVPKLPKSRRADSRTPKDAKRNVLATPVETNPLSHLGKPGLKTTSNFAFKEPRPFQAEADSRGSGHL